MGGMSGMAQVIGETAKRAQAEHFRKEMEERRNFIFDLTTHSYSQAQAYTNLVIGAGYVAFFSIWATVYQDISIVSKVWSIIPFIISAMIFVFWEVCKMVFTARLLRQQINLTNVQDPVKFSQAIARYKQKQAISEGVQARIWVYVLIATIIPAFIGCAFLTYGLFSLSPFEIK